MTLLRYGVCWLLCGASWVYAQTHEASAPALVPPSALETPADLQERARIQQEIGAVQQTLRQEESACYQRFAVQDCLRKARQNARQTQTGLRQQDAALDAAGRRQRAAQRRQEIAERESAHAAEHVPAKVPAIAPVTLRAKEVPRPRPERALQESQLDDLSRDQQAQERARQQQDKRKLHRATQAKAVSAQATEAAQARQLREENKAAAVERRARVRQSQANDAAAGRVPAAPLSPSP